MKEHHNRVPRPPDGPVPICSRPIEQPGNAKRGLDQSSNGGHSIPHAVANSTEYAEAPLLSTSGRDKHQDLNISGRRLAHRLIHKILSCIRIPRGERWRIGPVMRDKVPRGPSASPFSSIARMPSQRTSNRRHVARAMVLPQLYRIPPTFAGPASPANRDVPISRHVGI